MPTPIPTATPAHYDRRTVLYHWLSAVLVLALWVAGQTIDLLSPWHAAHHRAQPAHHLWCRAAGAGGAAAGLAPARWRQAAAVPGLAGRIAPLYHKGLYLLLIAVLALGVACVWIRGDNIFNLFTVPSIAPDNKALRHDAVELHGLLANILLFAAGAHALAALWHQFVLKDGLLARMRAPRAWVFFAKRHT